MYRNDLIRAAVVNKDLNQLGFAKAVGLSMNTVRKLWAGDVDLKLHSLATACRFLEIPLHKVFEPKEQPEANIGQLSQ